MKKIPSHQLYKPIIDKLYKTNLFIKLADTFVDIVRGFVIAPNLENGLKISVDCIQLSAIYYSHSSTLPLISLSTLYQVYNHNYDEAIKSIIITTGIIFMSTALYTTTPALSLIFTAGFTGYAGYELLKNSYELYNELSNLEGAELLNNNAELENQVNYNYDI